MTKFNSTLHTVNDLTALLNISKSTVYRLVKNKEISFVKIGSNTRFKPEAVREYLEKNSIESLSK